MNDDPICNERGIPESECQPFCPHDFGTTGPYGFTQPVSDADYRDAFFRVSERCDELQADAAERQWNALEMARKADAAERRAEEAEYHVEQLRDARDRAERRAEKLEAVIGQVKRVFDLQCPPMLPEKYVDRGAWMAHSWWDAVLGAVLRRDDLDGGDHDHEWLDRPESDTRECLTCGTEVAG